MNYTSALEALLFAFGDEGVSKEEVRKMFQMDETTFENFLSKFMERFHTDNRGMECMIYGDYVKLVTKKEHHELITAFLEVNTNRKLSQAALETLAIIAYKQPITRLEIEEIRGVNSDMMCRRLEALDLIQEAGRAETVGRPILYEVTPSFLDVFKLTSLNELPEINLEMEEGDDELFKTD